MFLHIDLLKGIVELSIKNNKKSSLRSKGSIQLKKWIISVGTIILAIIVGVLAVVPKLKNDKDVYSKLAQGEDINILIVGDSIGAPSGEDAWSTMLKTYLEDKYGSTININNISMGGNTSYAGYFRIKMLDEKENYDLAIICYGQNDPEEKFSLYYESIYNIISERFTNCSMISILESAQREYTYKMQTIVELAEYYEVPIADTITAFNNSGTSHEMLTEDGVHPNAEGHRIYFETIKDVIEEQMNYYAVSKKAINGEIQNFNNTYVYKVNDFRKIDDVSYEMKIQDGKVMLGVYYDYIPGENGVEIYSDDILLDRIEFDWASAPQQEHIDFLEKEYEVGSKIKIVFTNEVQANSFQGLSISYLEEK